MVLSRAPTGDVVTDVRRSWSRCFHQSHRRSRPQVDGISRAAGVRQYWIVDPRDRVL